MNTHTPQATECFLDPKDLEQLILKLRELARSLDDEADAQYINAIADDASAMDPKQRHPSDQ